MRSFLTAIALLGVIGCGSPQPGLKSTPVSEVGKVSLAGQPVGNVAVSFQPLDNGHQKSLPVKPDGTFQGELISGKYAYSLVQSTPESQQVLGKIPPQYLEPDLQRTVQVAPGQELVIALD